jgi:NADH-quinone oxidoreductase subunit M
MPIFAAFFMIITLSSIGLPGTNGFIGEFLILMGTWKANPLFAIIATSGVIWAAVYMLWMFQRVMFEKVTNPKNEHLKDLSLREIAYFTPFIALIFILGVFPTPILEKMEPTVERIVQQVTGVRAIAIAPVDESAPVTTTTTSSQNSAAVVIDEERYIATYETTEDLEG